MVIGLFKKPFNAARPGDNRDFVSPLGGKKILENCVENLLFPSSYLFAFSPPSLFPFPSLDASRKKRKEVIPHTDVNSSNFLKLSQIDLKPIILFLWKEDPDFENSNEISTRKYVKPINR